MVFWNHVRISHQCAYSYVPLNKIIRDSCIQFSSLVQFSLLHILCHVCRFFHNSVFFFFKYSILKYGCVYKWNTKRFLQKYGNAISRGIETISLFCSRPLSICVHSALWSLQMYAIKRRLNSTSALKCVLEWYIDNAKRHMH